ncbi:MAG TPA: hypothetical protein VGM02_17885 [Acidobacteriaceae bacterium]|jgi:hypothetical protein
MRGDRIPFSQILPLIDLALLVILVFVPITLTALHLYEASKGADQVHIHTADSDISLPRNEIVPLAIRLATVPKAHTMMAINLPGALIQWLISLPSRTPQSGWHPQALLLETWDALVFPFFALPFWWLVGCGFDVLIHKERLHWSCLLIGTVLSGLCLAAVIAFCFPMSAADRADLTLPVKGFLGWTIAFAVLPIAWIAQSIRKRRNRSAGTAPP